jgi:tetratricopeptide (TPR) repeat protein
MSEASASDKPVEKDAESSEEAATRIKAAGTAAFKEGKYDEAIKLYSEAITLNSSDQTLFSNRSAAYGESCKYKEALADAQQCVKLRPDWAKGYARVGYAQFHLERYPDAMKAYTDGLAKDPNNDSLKDGLWEVQEKERKIQAKAQAPDDVSDSRGRRTGIKGTLRKLVNPLGLSTTGAIIYAVSVISAILLIVFLRARQAKAAGDGDGDAMDAEPDL